MEGKLLRIFNLPQVYRIRRITPAIPVGIGRYSQLSNKQGAEGNGDRHQGKEGNFEYPSERAPSTAEEFRRVAEEKARQGVGSQSVEKAADGVREAATGNTATTESVKETLKEPVE